MTKRYLVSATVEELGDQPGYLAVCSDVPGCLAQGDTIGEALEYLQDVVRATLEMRVERGLGIPEGLREVDAGDWQLTAQIAVPFG
jgi:predicted RNase H-like HicB family nuclease